MDEFTDKYKKQMEDFVEKTIKNGIVNYCKKNDWIKYDGENFIIIDENIKQKINNYKFSSALQALDVIKLYLKQNNNYVQSFEDENWDNLAVDNTLGELS